MCKENITEHSSLLVDDSLYLGTRWESGVRIVWKSRVKSWDGWPDDVRATLRLWNKEHRLSFAGMDMVGRTPPQPTFKCPHCQRFVNPSGSTTGVLDGLQICDDCLVKRVRDEA